MRAAVLLGWCAAQILPATGAETTKLAFHHHIHNFSVDVWNKSNPDYAMAHKHAKEMGYSLVTGGRAAGISYGNIGQIKFHNAYYAPARIDFGTYRILYFDYYADPNRKSLIRPDRQVAKWYPLDPLDLRLLKVFACARKGLQDLTLENFNLDTAKEHFFLDWTAGSQTNVVANLDSKWVVQRLIDASLESVTQSQDAALFFDDLARQGHDCANAETGNSGHFKDWKSGQKYWVQQVAQEFRHAPGERRFVFGNIWDPNSVNVGKTWLKWYADGSLRLDHYYYEAGPQKNQGVEAKKVAQDTYEYVSSNGFLPAGLVSMSTTYGFYGARISDSQKAIYIQGKKNYFGNTLEVAGVAGKQGSWFGWYGESNLNTRELVSGKETGPLVHTNDLQLLRAIPGWDNLASVPLKGRSYDRPSGVYSSPNSYFSPQLIYSRHFSTGEMFAVFKSNKGRIELRPGENVVSAWFVNNYFGKTDESAVTCLQQSGHELTLTCDEGLDRGIRIHLSSSNQGKRP